MTQDYPEVGRWYRRGGDEQAFQVVAVDAVEGTAEVQYFDGTVDEMPIAAWAAQGLETCEPSQDWTGPFDGIARDDLGASATDMTPEDWNEPYHVAHDTTPGAAEEDTEVDPSVQAPDLLAPELLESGAAMEQLSARPTRRRVARRRHP